MASARSVGRSFSPLDEELELLPGSLSPWVEESLVRLGTWMPFHVAAEMLYHFTRVHVTEPTARRQTEQAGAAYVAVQEAEVERIERELPVAPAGPEKQLVSVDGAMVPLVHGEWVEVKTLVIGEVAKPVLERGEWVVHSRELSYFSRLADADTFGRLALVETHHRGTERAGQVAAVTDGAEWEQGFIDLHRPDAVRILDFPHPAERISQVGQALFGEGTPQANEWVAVQWHRLKHDGPAAVLAELASAVQSHPELSTLEEHLNYLRKRAGHMEYPAYQRDGWPIGSGAVESANKLVVEARLKGAGMHWARVHVDPLLALRNVVCSDRWEEAWPQIARCLRQQTSQQRLANRKRRQETANALSILPASPQPPVYPSLLESTSPLSISLTPEPGAAQSVSSSHRSPSPAPNHPWRHSPIGRARYRSSQPDTNAKT